MHDTGSSLKTKG